jgi:hypothetical protein
MVFDMSKLREKFLSSSLMGVNTLIGGYIPKVPYGLYGPPASGKSIFSIQEAYAIAKQMSEKEGKLKGILYYDTEGDGDILHDLWQKVMIKRLGKQKWVYMDTEISAPKEVDMKKDPDSKLILKVCKDWGIDAKIRKEIGKSKVFRGKVRFEYQGDVHSRVEAAIRKHNIGVIIIDSVTEPIDNFPGGTMNFPARANAIKYWFGQVHLFAKRYGVVVLALHHSTKNPQGAFEREQMVGGKTLLYRFKVLMCIERVGKERKIRLARHFNKEDWEEEVRLILDDDGWRDSTSVPKFSKPPKSIFKK